MKITRNRIFLVVFAIAVVGLIIYAFRPQPAGVDLAQIIRGPMRITVDEDGKTRIKQQHTISAPLGGRLLRIDLAPNDEVKAGETILAAIEPTEPMLLDARTQAEAEARLKAAQAAQQLADANVERARATYDLAKTTFERAKRLGESGGISSQELDQAEHRERTAAEEAKSAAFALQVAEFETQIAQAALLWTKPDPERAPSNRRLEIRSPITGRVLRVFQKSATVVLPGMPLLELGDRTDLEIEIDVLSSDAVRIQPGAKVLLERWGGENLLEGRVRLVEPSAFTRVSALGVEEQRVWVIADFVSQPEKWHKLGDGYRIETRIIIWENENVLKAPTGALFRHRDQWAAFAVENGGAKLRPIRIGKSNGLEAQILDGLDEGDQVVLYPSDKIADGVAVAPR